MKIKTRDLTGPALEFVVAQCGDVLEEISVVRCNDLYFPNGNEHGQHYEPYYKAYTRVVTCYGPSPEIAVRRCRVFAVLGEEVDVPDHLVPNSGD